MENQGRVHAVKHRKRSVENEILVPHVLAVSPSRQGKGIGRYFMEEILKLAKTEKKKR